MSLHTYIAALPKAELHIHLEGAIRPATLLCLANRNGIELPAKTEGDLTAWFVFNDFEQFRTVIRTCGRSMVRSEDYELAVYELGRELAGQHVLHAEVAFGPTTPYFRGIDQTIYMDGLASGRRRVLADFGLSMNWIFELGRGPEQNGQTWDYTTAVAIEGKDHGVVALGLAGPEYRLQTASFAPWFDRARSAGLHSRPHAGELAGPPAIWDAVRALGAERIGHGVRAMEDPHLPPYLAEQGIPIELCPRSNVSLGVCASLADHPLPRLHAAGVPLTVNSDDPSLFTTDLTAELLTLVDPFRMAVAAIDDIVLNGIRQSFLPPEQRRTLEERFRQEMAALKAVHLASEAIGGHL